MAQELRTLPDYGKPPVTEIVLGVQFERLRQFSVLHSGIFWDMFRHEYPYCSLQPALGDFPEIFSASAEKKIALEMIGETGPPLRCWLMDSPKNIIIQIQADRFITNWRQVTGEEPYIRFEPFKKVFVKEWERFLTFLHKQNIEAPMVTQCEMLYVNHIEVPEVISDFGDLHRLLKCWSSSDETFLPKPQFVAADIRYAMPDDNGSLHVSIQPTISGRDGKGILQLNLLARGKPDAPELDDILKWFNKGHEWIVKGFTELTTSEMHTYWRRKL